MNTVRINGQDYTSSLSDAEIAFMGNFSLPTTAQTLSGAIAEHENDISELNSNLVKRPSINLNNAYTDNIQLIIALPSITFSNGTGTVSISSYLPTNYTFSTIAFASMISTSTLSITGCEVDATNKTVTVRCGSSYSGSQYVQLLLFARHN